MSVENHEPGQRYLAGPVRWWLLALGAVLTLTLVTWGFAASVSTSVEADVRDALEAAGLENVVIESASYRDVTLRGPDADAEVALDVTEGVPLVSTLTYVVDEAADDPAPGPSATEQPTVGPSPAPSVTSHPTPASTSQVQAPELPSLEPVLFDAFSSDLNGSAQSALDVAADRIIDALESHTSITVRLDGYSDSFGTDEDNQELTQHRVDKVRAYLARAGVPTNIMDATAHGEDSPVASNLTEDGRAQNRRVEITITEGRRP